MESRVGLCWKNKVNANKAASLSMTLPFLSCVSDWVLVKNQEKKECWTHMKAHFLCSILKRCKGWDFAQALCNSFPWSLSWCYSQNLPLVLFGEARGLPGEPEPPAATAADPFGLGLCLGLKEKLLVGEEGRREVPFVVTSAPEKVSRWVLLAGEIHISNYVAW